VNPGLSSFIHIQPFESVGIAYAHLFSGMISGRRRSQIFQSWKISP
jgi:hypothetical protein